MLINIFGHYINKDVLISGISRLYRNEYGDTVMKFKDGSRDLYWFRYKTPDEIFAEINLQTNTSKE